MSLHLRGQHAALALLVLTSLASGVALGPHAAFGAPARFGLWKTLHFGAGIGAVAVLAYHLLYLAIRGYVEGRGLGGFPLRWSPEDWQVAAGEVHYLLGRAETRPEAGQFRPSQKFLYWATGTSLAAICASGAAVGFWERAGTIEALAGIADLHRGLAQVLLAGILWHLYGVLVWEGRWSPEWTWLTGRISHEKAAAKLPAFHRAWLREMDEEREAARRSGEEEARDEERVRQEKEEVEAELERGNRLAIQEKYVEAVYHYRRALERYPGYSQARYNMARVLARMGEKAMAIEAYRQFLEGDPFHPLAARAQEAIRELEEGGV